MERQAPYSISPLPKEEADKDYSLRLPASHRDDHDILSVPNRLALTPVLEKELLVRRLNGIEDWLWACGRPMPPRPLSKQILLGRDVVITEDIDHHLVWTTGKIYIKPLPLYLLHPSFWTDHLLDRNDLETSMYTVDKLDQRQPSSASISIPHGPAAQKELAACARGLLFSYVALIMYESNLNIAKDRGLLPNSISWESWRGFSAEYLAGHKYSLVNKRYWFGELRLHRLNVVYQYVKFNLFRGFSSVASPSSYEGWLREKSAFLSLVFGFILLALGAMSTSLGTKQLKNNESLQRAVYGFAVFTVVSLAAAVGLIVLAAICLVVLNWKATKDYEMKNFAVYR